MIKKNKVDMVNIYRIIAFLCVFLLHSKIFIPVAWNEGVSAPWILYTPAWAGVWMFIFISGYGIGSGFTSDRYEMKINGIYKYFVSRLQSIVPLYWFYILVIALFICPTILLPRRENLGKLLSLLFFNYQEEFNSIEYGLAWYLTTMMRLYFIAPIFYWFVKRWLKGKKQVVILMLVLIIVGLFARLAMGYHISITGESWSIRIYKPFYYNLDIFGVGFLLSYLKKDSERTVGKRSIKLIAMVLLLMLILYNSYLYYHGSYSGNQLYMNIYCYLLPTVYILVCALYVYCFDVKRGYVQTELSLTEVKKNPLRIADYFRKIQMPIYLFHSTILLCLQNGYIDEKYTMYATYLGANSQNINFYKGCLFTIYALGLSLLWSIIVAKLFSSKESKVWKKISVFDMQNVLYRKKRQIINIIAKVFPAR